MCRLLTLLALVLPLPLAAETLAFDVALAGLRAATLEIEAEVAGRRYALAARLRTTGIAGAVRRVRYAATASGRLDGGAPRPEAYAEDLDTGRRTASTVIAYAGGVPAVTAREAARPDRAAPVDPASQRGALDPLSALWAGLADRRPDEGCPSPVAVFDGRRVAATRFDPPLREGGRMLCRGVFRRVAGYPPEDMAERRQFAIAVTYAPAGGGRLRAVEVRVETLYGQAVLKRR
jgi:hypothetical protein